MIIIRNQLTMIYDVGIALGQPEHKLTKEVLLGIMTSATGTASAGVLTIHGGKVLVKRSSLRMMQKIIAMLGGKISQRMLRAVISKWLPVVGAVAMAGWVNYSTKKIGKTACNILISEIEFIDERALAAAPVLDGEPEAEASSYVENEQLLFEKLSAFINLIKIDGHVDDEERNFIQDFLEESSLSKKKRALVLKQLESSKKYKVQYALFKNEPDDATSLMIDLVALAKADGIFHPAEKMYIRRVGKALELPDEDIEWLCS